MSMVSFLDAIDFMFVQGEGGSDMSATPNGDSVFCSPSPSSATSLTSSVDSSRVKYKAASKTPSRAGTPKPRSMLKRTLQDAFAKGSVKENEMLECLGTQKHECVIVELELKRRKLKNKVMKKQHQRECKCKQHEFHMLQMRLMVT